MNTADMRVQIDGLVAGCDMVIDAIFGTGLNGRLRDEHIELIENINAAEIAVMAVDIPSGLDCDTGMALGAAIKAKYTVTFVAVKTGFVAAKESSDHTGEIFIASLGVEPSAKKPD